MFSMTISSSHFLAEAQPHSRVGGCCRKRKWSYRLIHPPITLSELYSTLTNLTHQTSHPRVLTIATGPHTMSSVIDLEAQQVQAAPGAGAFFPLFSSLPKW
jgi:hypothetical protein